MDLFNDNNFDVNFNTNPITPSDFGNTYNSLVPNSFAVSHVNVRSMNKNFEELKLLYETVLTEKFKVIGVSETWAMYNSNLFNLNSYNLEYNCRKIGRGGGVAAYIHNSVNYKILPLHVLHSESLWLELIDNKHVFIVGIIYRKPNTSVSEFHTSLLDVLCSIKLDKKQCILMGDFNMDFSKPDISIDNFQTNMICLNLKQLVLTPTRITSTTETVIDHIYMAISIIVKFTRVLLLQIFQTTYLSLRFLKMFLPMIMLTVMSFIEVTKTSRQLTFNRIYRSNNGMMSTCVQM